MSEISDKIHEKCLAFSDRIIKLNDYLLKEAANAKPSYKMVKGKRVYEKAVPVYLQSVSAICNQLLRSGTSIGANNAEATNAVSKQEFRAKSYIALKEARESLYWIELLHRNKYLDDKGWYFWGIGLSWGGERVICGPRLMIPPNMVHYWFFWRKS